MEWVTTTGRSVAEALERALDQLGVAEDEAEFEVLAEPRTGLLGLLRGEARIRARIRPAPVRPKQDRRTRGRRSRESDEQTGSAGTSADPRPTRSTRDDKGSRPAQQRSKRSEQPRREPAMPVDEQFADGAESVAPEAVGQAAVEFMEGLTSALGVSATTTLRLDGEELDVSVAGEELGLLIGPGGRTLTAVQDLARVAAQRRLGDHSTRLRIDIAGYRERRREALEQFATAVAQRVIESGRGTALEPMPSADRKIVHDAIQEIDGVTSHSDGEDPRRRVVIVPS